MKQHYLN